MSPPTRLRALFMGSPEFAVPVLAALADHHDVALVITQPDRPAGRGMKLQASPVKAFALARGLPVGGELEFSDAATVAQALRERRDFV